MITHERLSELLSYDSETGIFRRLKKSQGSKANIGDIAGSYSPRDKTCYVSLDHKVYQLHNLAWFYVHGEWPDRQLLHKDDDGKNNAIANLHKPSNEKVDLTYERLREVLDYNPETGVFTWRIRANKDGNIGKEAGTVDPNGYRYIAIDKGNYLAQRLAWLYVNGVWPGKLLRFQDRDKRNLRIANLYEGVWLDTEFDHSTPEGRSAHQKAFRVKHPEHVKSQDLRKSYGIDIEQYKSMLVEQNGVCEICSRPETRTMGGKLTHLAVDHDHVTGMIRGLLCVGCNTGLGGMGDDPERLRLAADYIDRYRKLDNVVPLRAKE